MPRKRKQPPSQGQRKRAAKRRRKETLLTELPIEILDDILAYSLPDPTSPEGSCDPFYTANLFTNPLLQTNTALRQGCLKLIDRRTIWIYVEARDRLLVQDFSKALLTLQLLPPKLRHLIQPNAANIHVCCRTTEAKSQRVTRSFNKDANTFIFPFNFDRLLYLSDVISEFASEMKIWNVTVQCYNVAGHFERQVQDLVIPALSTLRNLDCLDFELEGRAWCPDVVDEQTTTQEWLLDDLTSKAQDVVERAEKLIEGGYADEAGLLMLSSYWILEEAEMILPSAEDWVLGEIDADIAYYEWNMPPFAGRCPKGNQLRSLVHKIEHKARSSFAELITRYGREWYISHQWMFEDVMERFIEDPDFAWFGLSVSESVELYYSRALCQEALGRIMLEDNTRWFATDQLKMVRSQKKGKPELTHTQQVNIKAAATFMFFARMLDPDNNHIRDLYRGYKKLLGLKVAKEMEFAAMDRFTMIRDNSDPAIDWYHRPIKWSGDAWLLDRWGGEESLQYLPLAQKGLTMSPTFAEWGVIFRAH